MPIYVTKKIRVMFAGGGTGGHMYPLIAVHDYLEKIGEGNISFSFVGSPGGFLRDFEDRGVKVHKILASKIRRYFDLRNIFDGPKFLISLLQAMTVLFFEMPDVLFSKGGPGSLAVVIAASFYRIPIIIHESDSVPSMTNLVAAKFAKVVATAFPSAAESFKGKKIVVTGQPVRSEILETPVDTAGSKSYFGFNEEEPMLLVLGGSQGAEKINNFVVDHLDAMLGEIQIYHQVGAGKLKKVQEEADLNLNILPPGLHKKYVVKPYLGGKEMRLALNACDMVLSRAGSGAIFEIAALGKPAILVPLQGSANGHQVSNAFQYSKTGAALVFEENNLEPNLVKKEVKKVFEDRELRERMSLAAVSFSKPDAAESVGREVLGVLGIRM